MLTDCFSFELYSIPFHILALHSENVLCRYCVSICSEGIIIEYGKEWQLTICCVLELKCYKQFPVQRWDFREVIGSWRNYIPWWTNPLMISYLNVLWGGVAHQTMWPLRVWLRKVYSCCGLLLLSLLPGRQGLRSFPLPCPSTMSFLPWRSQTCMHRALWNVSQKKLVLLYTVKVSLSSLSVLSQWWVSD